MILLNNNMSNSIYHSIFVGPNLENSNQSSTPTQYLTPPTVKSNLSSTIITPENEVPNESESREKGPSKPRNTFFKKLETLQKDV